MTGALSSVHFPAVRFYRRLEASRVRNRTERRELNIEQRPQ